MSYSYLMWKNLWRRKLRTTLTLAAIFIAFLIFGVLRAFEGALNSGVELAAADRLVVINKINFTVPLPIAYVNKVAAVDGVERVTFASWFGAYWQEPRNQFAAFAADAESYLASYPELVIDPEQRERFLSNRTGALVGAQLAARFGWSVGDHIPIQSTIWTKEDGSNVYDMTIDGIFEGADERIDTTYMLFHYDYLNESRQFGKDQVGWLIVTTESQERNEAVADTIDAMFFNSAKQTKTDTEKAFSAAFVKQLGNIGLILILVVGAAFFTILVIAGNTMVLSIRERIAEIAVMKTLGFTDGKVFGLVLGESLFMALFGGVPGLACAWLAAEGLSAAMAGFLPRMVLSDMIVLQGLAIVLILGLVTGAIPAITALRLNIVSGLARG